MADSAVITIYLAKAEECLIGAESEFANDRYNNAANRCYYACFEAAIAALLRADIPAPGPQWSHEFVHGRFAGQLVNRRKTYAAELRTTLANCMELRLKADYGEARVTRREASHALEWARALMAAVRRGDSQ